MSAAESPRAVLLDRDGTINVKAPEGQYIVSPSEVALLPGAGRAVAALNRRGIPVVVVTNQRGIARGVMTEDDLADVHRRLAELLARCGGRIDAWFHCPHEKGVCSCRKPGTLLLEQAREYLKLDTLDQTVMIGDSHTDVLAGRSAGARAILIGAPSEGGGAGSLEAAVDALLRGTPHRAGHRAEIA